MWSRIRQWALGSTLPTNLDQPLAVEHWLWAAGSLCALHRQPFDADLLQQQFPPPITVITLEQALLALGFQVEWARGNTADWSSGQTTLLAVREPAEGAPTARLDLLVRVTPDEIHHIEAGTTQAQPSPRCTFENASTRILRVTPIRPGPDDPDALAPGSRFGFRWFMPELLKHRSVWHEVLLASLVLQLLALGTPLFTQAIIDKVVVHRTESTLIAIALGMAIFMVFSALLSWTRQTLVLHTGNRVDTVLGSEVVDHLFKLPLRYFEKRPTGVIAARLHGVETIREFIASAAVSLVLDLPFLLVFVGIMFWYSVPLTLVALAVLAVIVGISLAVAPRFQDLLNEQFLLGARNQAFLTEHVAGKLEESLPHYRRSTTAFERLGDEGFFSPLAVADKRREWIEKERDLQAQSATLAGMQAQVLASEKRLAQLTSRYQSELRTQRSELVSDLQRLDAELAKARHKSAWLELRAPQRGVVKELGTHTIGAVVSPGTVLMSIVPIDEPLLAEVWVRHEDAGFVHTGQKARLKIAAYPFQKYGMLDGEVSRLGADASNEVPTATAPSPPTGSSTSAYKALVHLDRQQLEWDDHSLELSAGMQVIADLHQGRRTVLDYLLSPVQKAWHEAARER